MVDIDSSLCVSEIVNSIISSVNTDTIPTNGGDV